MKIASVTSKGQIVIPSKLRKELNIKKGTRLSVEIKGAEIIFKPVTEEYFRKMAGILKLEIRKGKGERKTGRKNKK